MSKNTRKGLSPEEEIEYSRQEIARLTNELKDYVAQFPSIPNDLTDEQKGEHLLNAFLTDKPFDKFAFAYQPVKISFLNAAFRTCDYEIISYALNFVRATLDQRAFDQILDSTPQFRGAYDQLACRKHNIIKRKENAEEMKGSLQEELKSTTELMKYVIKDEIDRLSGKPLMGYEEVDLKWDKIFRSPLNPIAVSPKEFAGKFKLFSKWKVSVNPSQAAIVCKLLRYPPEVVAGFAHFVKDDKEKAEMLEFGIRP